MQLEDEPLLNNHVLICNIDTVAPPSSLMDDVSRKSTEKLLQFVTSIHSEQKLSIVFEMKIKLQFVTNNLNKYYRYYDIFVAVSHRFLIYSETRSSGGLIKNVHIIFIQNMGNARSLPN